MKKALFLLLCLSIFPSISIAKHHKAHNVMQRLQLALQSHQLKLHTLLLNQHKRQLKLGELRLQQHKLMLKQQRLLNEQFKELQRIRRLQIKTTQLHIQLIKARMARHHAPHHPGSFRHTPVPCNLRRPLYSSHHPGALRHISVL